MRRMIPVPLFAAGLCAVLACSSAQRAPQRFGGRSEADSLFYRIERTPCFGRCPTYALNVYRSGYATFTGTRNVPLVGPHATRVPHEVMEKILAQAERIGFFEMQDTYDSPVTDLPSTIVRVVSGDRDKQVTGRHGMPESFRKFALAADSLLISLPWKPLEGAR